MRWEERDAIVRSIGFGLRVPSRFRPKKAVVTDLSAVDWGVIERGLEEYARTPKTLEGCLARWLPLVKARKMKLSELPEADRKLLVQLGKQTYKKT